MGEEKQSLTPILGANRALRRRLDLKGEFALAMLPTATVLIVLAFVEVLSRQRLLFASLASSAFLIYLDPQHGTNTIRTLVMAQSLALAAGLITYALFGAGYIAAGSAMVATIAAMIILDAVHPPAVSTSVSFAFRAASQQTIVLFGLALGIVVVLVILQRVALWMLARFGT